MKDLAFYGFAAALLAGAVGTVVSRSLYRAAFSLAATLLATAGLYFLLTAAVLGAVQILLYTGGVLTLTVYAVALTDGERLAGPRWRRPLPAAVLAGGLAVALGSAALSVEPSVGLGGLEDGRALGVEVFTTYLVPFELLSVLLLGAIFGALVVARKEREP
jgi:NADH:ubiquinone oxidoreductase subunit 6 (subunit J)